MSIILIVDDDMTSLKLAKGILDEEYRVATVNSGAMVFKYLEHNTPNLIMLDINMPEMDGFQVLERLRANPAYASIPVMFLTASQDAQSEAKCLESGAIDFVAKPFIPVVLQNRVRRILELFDYRQQLESMVANQSQVIINRTERITQMQNSIIIGMANLIELRDNNTGKHVKNTQTYVEMICNKLKEQGLFSDILTDEYISNTVRAAPLHDVGKIKISDTILNKPGPLTDEEFRIIQDHTRYGAEIVNDLLAEVEDSEYLAVAHDIALYHHERWDGTGYPEGLSRDSIPLCARIMALADVFDALYEDRVYKVGIRPVKAAMSIIEDARGLQFDPVIADIFINMAPQLRDYLGEEED